MEQYHYSQLAPTSIRLLRLLPGARDSDVLQCELFEHSLQASNGPSYPYEALSYVWGCSNPPNYITIGSQNLSITPNLYTALRRLRYESCSRVLWVDAVCINQKCNEEKEYQIRLMAEIYARALCVVVWLGEAAEGSHSALETIRLTGENPARISNAQSTKQEVLDLLQRPWFQRIWVLQEMAAARHVLIMCGSTEIDGHAFCLGLDALGKAFEKATPQVAFLIRGAIFRPKSILKTQEKFSLDICSLGELIDMYHTHNSTERHDMVYALLSMCSDESTTAGLDPDYSILWSELMRRLVKFLLDDSVSVNVWDDKNRVYIKATGCVLGKVSKTEINAGLGGGQNVEAVFENTSNKLKHSTIGIFRWTLPTSARLIQEGDLICLLQGASKLTIVRLCDDHFAIVMIAAIPPEQLKSEDVIERVRSASFTRNFPLVWDWKMPSEEFQDPRAYTEFMLRNDLQLDVETGLAGQLSNASRRWHAALILGDLGLHKQAGERLQQAIDLYTNTIGEEHWYLDRTQYGLTPLCWAAGNGYGVIVDLLLTKDNIDIDLKDSQYGQTPLSLAAERGHDSILKLLLATGRVNVNSRNKYGQTPFSLAAEHGHNTTLELLHATGMVDINKKDKYGRTPLLYAAVNEHTSTVKLLLGKNANFKSKDIYGHTPLSYAAWYRYAAIVELFGKNEAHVSSINAGNHQHPLAFAAFHGHKGVVKLLLEIGKVDADLKDEYGQTPLFKAVSNGHKAVVKLLLETVKVDAGLKNIYHQTPLWVAAKRGHEAVVKLLLEKDEVDVNSEDKFGQTPLWIAAKYGRKAVVKLLLEIDKTDANSEGVDSQTPLWVASKSGNEAVVKLLLETGKVDVNSKDRHGETPLSKAAQYGHEAIVKLLLKTDKVDADPKDVDGQTPLWAAANNGQEAVVKLLLETNKVDADSQDDYGETPISKAAENGHEAVFKLLLETGKVDANSTDRQGRTLLYKAAKNGHEAVVKLLLETENVDVNSKDMDGQTPLWTAATNGHEAVVKLLLDTGNVDVNSEDSLGETPRSKAAQNGHETVAQLLLEAGKVDAASKDVDFQTLILGAGKNRHKAVD